MEQGAAKEDTVMVDWRSGGDLMRFEVKCEVRFEDLICICYWILNISIVDS